MTEAAMSRPDLAAYEAAMRAEPTDVVKTLRDLLGARLVAFIANVGETRAVHEWADGKRTIRETGKIERLRLALYVAQIITTRDTPAVAQAWFQGLNPKLGDQAPARLLREGNVDEAGPRILAAARSFASVG